MVLTVSALLLSLFGIAVFPCWRYSARWGYAPAIAVGAMLFFVSLVSLGSKAITSEALSARHTVAAATSLLHTDPMPPRRSIEIAELPR
jgi:hypothetical protein